MNTIYSSRIVCRSSIFNYFNNCKHFSWSIFEDTHEENMVLTSNSNQGMNRDFNFVQIYTWRAYLWQVIQLRSSNKYLQFNFDLQNEVNFFAGNHPKLNLDHVIIIILNRIHDYCLVELGFSRWLGTWILQRLDLIFVYATNHGTSFYQKKLHENHLHNHLLKFYISHLNRYYYRISRLLLLVP